MAGLADSIWAKAPSTPSISAGQINKPAREPRGASGTNSRNSNPARRRGRGGGGNKSSRPNGSDDAPVPPSSNGTSTIPATPSSKPPPSSKPRPNPPARTPSSDSVRPVPSRASSTGVPSSAKSDAGSVDSSVTGARKSRRRGGGKNSPATKRKASLAISVPAGNEEPLSTIIEPATPAPEHQGASSTSQQPIPSPTLSSAPWTPSPPSSQPETLPPVTPAAEKEYLKPAVVIATSAANLRPTTPASHIDWADDDEDDLPTLDDWGVPPTPAPETKPVTQGRNSSSSKIPPSKEAGETAEGAEILVVSEEPLDNAAGTQEGDSHSDGEDEPDGVSVAGSAGPKGAKGLINPTEDELRLWKKLRNERTKERRKATKARKTGAASEAVAPRAPRASLLSRIGGFAADESQGHATSDVAPSSSLPAKPVQTASLAPPTETSGASTASVSPKTQAHTIPVSPSLPARPHSAQSNNSAFSSSRRKPFAGQASFGLGRSDRPSSVGGLASDRRRDRPTSAVHHHAHSASRPVISPGALSQLTQSLSGGSRAHRAPAVTAE